MDRARFQSLPTLPAQRLCPCGQPVRWSHLEYLGSGRTAGVYLCAGCGLAYRGPVPERSSRGRAKAHPLPAQGHPENPVLDEEMGRRLKELLSSG
ncbi:MAG: hypothetical protein ACREN4_01375 [Candidatus Dormibacteria bacterium]